MAYRILAVGCSLFVILSASFTNGISTGTGLLEEENFLAKLGRFVLNELKSDESLQGLLNRNHRRRGEHIKKQTKELVRELDIRQNASQQRQDEILKLLHRSSEIQQNLSKKLDSIMSLLQRATFVAPINESNGIGNTTELPPATTTIFHKNCQPPWHLLTSNICVRVTNTTGNWTNVQKFCSQIGGFLLSFNNKAEIAVIRKFVKSFAAAKETTSTYFWLGHRYIDYQPTALHSLYIPPRDLYWKEDPKWFNECSLFYGDGDLVTWECNYVYPFGLCRKSLS